MINQLRSITLGLGALLCTAAFAQPLPPYQVTVTGTIAGCTPTSYVNILTVQNTQPALDIDVPLTPNSCTFSIDLSMDSFQGWFVVSTPCNGAMLSQTVSYTVNALFPDSTIVFVNFTCGGGNTDCLGVPGGSALPGTACTTALGFPGTWSAACNCVANSTPCQACFTASQSYTNPNGGTPIPFSATFMNCSSGGVAPFTYAWSFDGGSTYAAGVADTAVTFATGAYLVCLMIADANGCTSSTCDSLVVDANGGINNGSVIYDCLQVANGPNLPGAPCTVFGTTIQGIWSAACVCVPDTNTTVCEANFWVMQAYTLDSIGNPNGGDPVPIPNEVWVWNLSSGGSGNYQFLWNFGDGSAPSTDPYPTHIYANGGPYELCLTMYDSNGCTDTYCDSISIDANGIYTGMAPEPGDGSIAEFRSGFTLNVISQLPTAVPERNTLEDIALWPNPVNDAIGLSLVSTLSGRIELTVMDLNGRTVMSTSDAVNSGNNRFSLPVGELLPGMYLLRITDGTRAVSRRFVKQ